MGASWRSQLCSSGSVPPPPGEIEPSIAAFVSHLSPVWEKKKKKPNREVSCKLCFPCHIFSTSELCTCRPVLLSLIPQPDYLAEAANSGFPASSSPVPTPYPSPGAHFATFLTHW